jgi:DNA-binding transcriptional ArsR family regulator
MRLSYASPILRRRSSRDSCAVRLEREARTLPGLHPAVEPEHLLERVAQRFGYLSDATRLRVLSAVAQAGEASVGAVAERSGVALPSVSQHLNKLAAGGIVARRRQGTSVLYSVADPTVEELCALVCAGVDENGG